MHWGGKISMPPVVGVRIFSGTTHLLHLVTKHEFGIETGDIHIFLNNLLY